MQAWSVWLHEKCLTVVFYAPSCDADYVKRTLVNHDGYNAAIQVRKQK